MIQELARGHYRVMGIRGGGRILYLDGQGYHWNYAKGIGEILTLCKHPHKAQYVLAQGGYKRYLVRDEPTLVDLPHLELGLGNGRWQGYLLLTGLPTPSKIRSRIIATNEVVAPRLVTDLSTPLPVETATAPLVRTAVDNRDRHHALS